jgi:hypothetical protein
VFLLDNLHSPTYGEEKHLTLAAIRNLFELLFSSKNFAENIFSNKTHLSIGASQVDKFAQIKSVSLSEVRLALTEFPAMPFSVGLPDFSRYNIPKRKKLPK